MPTPHEHKIYQFISKYIHKKGYAPSLKEIAEGIGISPQSKSLISRRVHALAKEGLVSLSKNGYRNIRLNEENYKWPLLGKIAAGAPIEAITSTQTLDLRVLLGGENRYILQVKGDSMVEDGILNGDYVLIRATQKAREGDVVVALIDRTEATLKHISFKQKGFVVLLPANSNLKPQIYLPERVQIQGVLVGLLRFP